MKTRGRPKTSAQPRQEQLRLAKRAQRARQRQANLVDVQITLPRQMAVKLAAARRMTDFAGQLDVALDRLVIRPADYAQLHDLMWNRTDEFIPAREAFQLYERNWRFVAVTELDDRERHLIERLKTEFGNGEINS
jgi:hypothetical protein